MNPSHKVFNTLIEEYYSSLFKAKEEGRKVGWCTSNFPIEIPESLGLEICFPENHSATLANSTEGEKYLLVAEEHGYSNDLCSYARINLGYIESFDSRVRNLPKPDFLLCSSNTCHQLLKWFEILKERFQIPLYLIDIPQTMKGKVDEDTLLYVSSQIGEVIESLAEFTNTTFSNERFSEVLEIASACGKVWRNIHSLLSSTPSPINGFDLFVMMSLMVVRRGRKETLDAFRLYESELRSMVQEKKSRYPGKEKQRVYLEGLTCWANLMEMQLPLLERGINLVGSTYTELFGLVYDSYPEMVKAYCEIPNALSLEEGILRRKDAILKSKADGILFNVTRSCRIWCGNEYEMERRLQEETGLPTLVFDGDQADKRNFSYAQYETRVQAFDEIMKENR